MSGLFITIEGPDGAGKSSVIKELANMIEANSQIPVILTREPGGIPISEEIRKIILDPKNTMMDERTEALLYAAARRQHLIEKIIPNLEENNLVLCDRFIDSSIAYQGGARGIGEQEIREINEFAIEGRWPDLTLYLDIDAKTGLERIAKGRKVSVIDRLDQESLAFHELVRETYLMGLEKEPERIFLIDASRTIEEVTKACYDLIKEQFPGLFVN